MRRPILPLAIALSLAACGNWSDSDARFLAGLPERDDLHVHPPTEAASAQQGLTSGDLGQSQSGLQADAFLNLDNMARQLNAWIDGLTGGLDLVRQLSPSVREDDLRIWGPYPDEEHPGTELQVVVTLDEAANRYAYVVEWRARGSEDEFTEVVSGSFDGAKAKGGSGTFTLDMEKAREVGVAHVAPDKILKLTLGYDHPEDGGVTVQLEEVLIAAADGSERTFQFSHRRDADESGAFSYVFSVPAKGYDVTATARWLPTRAGRVDGVGYSRFFQRVVANHHECWNEDLEVVYYRQDYDCGLFGSKPCEWGSKDDCDIPEPSP